MEEETITDDTHIWDNTSFNEYNQSLTFDESIRRLFQNVQEVFAKDVSYWGFYDRLIALGIVDRLRSQRLVLCLFSSVFSLETSLSLLGRRWWSVSVAYAGEPRMDWILNFLTVTSNTIDTRSAAQIR